MADLLPFTPAQFFDIFRQYHAGIGIAQALVLGVSVCGLSFAFWANQVAGRVVSATLAAIWLWMAVVYHGIYYSRINPAAPLFAVLFAVQAGLFLWEGVRANAVSFHFSATMRGWLGSLVIIYAIAVYPAMGFVFQQYYPSAPSFGTPGPTVIFTLGLLLWSNASWRLLVIPIVWAIIGTAYAGALHIPQDYVLGVAAVLVLALPGRASR